MISLDPACNNPSESPSLHKEQAASCLFKHLVVCRVDRVLQVLHLIN